MTHFQQLDSLFGSQYSPLVLNRCACSGTVQVLAHPASEHGYCAGCHLDSLAEAWAEHVRDGCLQWADECAEEIVLWSQRVERGE